MIRPILVLAVGTLVTQLACEKPSSADEPTISTILFGSCIKQDRPVPIFQPILAAQPEAFIFLGDNIYGDTEDMSVLREKYAKLGRYAGFQQLQTQSRILATWDDHDYGVNDGGADYPKRVESKNAFLDFWHVPNDSPLRRRPGIYDSVYFGSGDKIVQILLLDTRYFRSPLRKGAKRVGGSYVADPSDEKTMLGEAQWKWLRDELKKPAQFRIIATSIQCVAEASGQETWSNLPAERNRLFELIRRTRAEGVVLISGDRHWAEISVEPAAVGYPLYDITSSSLNQLHQRGTPTENRYRSSETTYHRENFGVLQFDWEQDDPTLTVEIRDMDSETQLEIVIPRSKLQWGESS